MPPDHPPGRNARAAPAEAAPQTSTAAKRREPVPIIADGRYRPHDLDAERALLGVLMRGAVVDELTAGHFYRPQHQLIYEAIEGLSANGGPADTIAVYDELRRRRQLTKLGGQAASYLHDCLAAAPAAPQAAWYAGIVREHAERRGLIEHASRLLQAASDPGEEMANVRALAAAPPVVAKAARGRRLVLTPASEIEPEPVIWAWEDNGQGRIPAGSFGLFAGREGTGKSTYLISIAAKVTQGKLPGMLWGRPRPVIYVTVEDSWKYTIVPRLIAAGADRDLIFRAEVEVVEGERVTLCLPADIDLLEDAVTRDQVALVALDPLMSTISERLDTHVNRSVRQALDPLALMADRTGAVVAGIAHFNKGDGTDASLLITGSGAFKDVPRFIFGFATDDGLTVITQTKNNLGRIDLPSLAYRIVDATVRTAKGDAKVSKFAFEGDAERTVRDILADQGGGDQMNRAKEYLHDALKDGPRKSKEVEEEALEFHDISQRTLKRARGKLRIPAAKCGDEWWISLPEHAGDLAGKSAKGANSA